jgi:hypothetical protein
LNEIQPAGSLLAGAKYSQITRGGGTRSFPSVEGKIYERHDIRMSETDAWLLIRS